MGSVGILLIGHKFGLPAERVGKDQSIWDRLETVRSTLEEAYFVAAEIFDPGAAGLVDGPGRWPRPEDVLVQRVAGIGTPG
jgi:hypothetical protein